MVRRVIRFRGDMTDLFSENGLSAGSSRFSIVCQGAVPQAVL
jgi:hypothetical protein